MCVWDFIGTKLNIKHLIADEWISALIIKEYISNESESVNHYTIVTLQAVLLKLNTHVVHCVDNGTVLIIGTQYLHPNLKKKIKKLYISFFEELYWWHSLCYIKSPNKIKYYSIRALHFQIHVQPVK